MPFPTSSFARTGRFSEIFPVGRGAVGQVYSAVDNLGRRVAVKEALPTAEAFAAFRGKFEKESRLQAALDHPNIVRVYHLEEDPETRELYLICEYADGGSLAELIEREGPLPEARAIALALDICAALEETERLRIVHRDVKPSNILLFTQPGGGLTAKLGDFGIAQDTRQRKTTLLPGTSHPGTPLYMAPEQADVTMLLDSRADIFSLGVTLWEMLTGEDYKALLRDGAGPTLQSYNPAASPGIARVIGRAVRPDREERYQTVRELAEDLRRVQQGQRPTAPPVRARPLARRAAPLALHGRAAPLATAVLLLGVALSIPGLMSLGNLLMAGGAGPMPAWALVSSLEPTVPPPAALSPSSTPFPFPTPVASGAPTAFPPTATPVPDVEAMAAVPPTPWLDGAAMAGPDGCLHGSGQVVSEQRQVGAFTNLVVGGIGIVEVRQGATEALRVFAEDNLLPLINSHVQDGTLVLGITGCIRNSSELRYEVTVRDLDSLTLAGAATARVEGLNSDRLSLRISGDGTITAAGAARELSVAIDGTGTVESRQLASVTAEVQVGGTGTVRLAASDRLDVQITGTGTVEYVGSPAVTQTISGLGSVEAVGGP